MAQQSRRDFSMQIALISPTTIWERLIHKLTGFTDRHRQALQRIRARVDNEVAHTLGPIGGGGGGRGRQGVCGR